MRRLLALALLFLTVTGCTPSASPPPPPAAAPYKDFNVIVISMNNVGAEHMSLYGYKQKTTPRLEELAKEALVFDRVYSPTSWTLPAATSLMTSLQPYSHRVMDRFEGNLLNATLPVLGELFKGSGYATATFTGGLDYRPTFGHLRGLTDSSFNLDFTQFDTSLAQATRWLSYNSDKKFFLVLQGYDAHPPFNPPAPFRGRFSGLPRSGPVTVSSKYTLRGFKSGDKYIASYIWEESNPTKRQMLEIAYPPEKRTVVLTQADMDYLRDLYDDTIASEDTRVADFIAHLDPKVKEHTIIVLLSEHGEMFGKHGRFGRAGTVRGTLYEDVVHVPLIIRLPGGKSGRLPGLVQIIDIAPTLLEWVGIARPQTFQGKSLRPMIENGAAVNEFAFGGSLYNLGSAKKGKKNPFFSESSRDEFIHGDRWKLLHEVVYAADSGPPPKPQEESWELYDLKADPDEQKNVLNENVAIAEDLKKKLAAWVEQTEAACKDKPPIDMAFPPDFQEKARHGGYW